MPNGYNSAYLGAQHDEYATKSALIDLIYPIGAVYISTVSTNPELLFGGTWEQIQDKFLLCAGSTYAGGTNGGAASVTSGGTAITTAQMPAHTHDKGSYSITGMIRCYSEYNKGNSSYDSNGVSGAFYFRTGTDTEYGTTTNMASGSNDAVRNVQFQANRSWSGSSGSTGSSQAHTHTVSTMPPYLAVYVFQRTA